MAAKTITRLPEWLINAVTRYQKERGLQSWSQAARELLALGAMHVMPDDAPRDESLIIEVEGAWGDEFDEWLEDRTPHEYLSDNEQYMIEVVLKTEWGGDRKTKETK